MIDLYSRSLADTHDIAAALASVVRPRDIIVLSGDMGAGKTAFATGFAHGLGVSEDEHVSSPTFTLVHTHDTGRIPLYHADLYRLTSVGEIADLGLREQADMGAVVLVEWGDVALDVLGDVMIVRLDTDDDDESTRHIELSVIGRSWDTRWERVKHVVQQWVAS
jgi:tRNA threonylcarbamoyladenosine biosynthesis protein TsaE